MRLFQTSIYTVFCIVLVFPVCAQREKKQYWNNGKIKQVTTKQKKKKDIAYYNQLGELIRLDNYVGKYKLKQTSYSPEAYVFNDQDQLTAIRLYNSKGYLSPQNILNKLVKTDVVLIKYSYDKLGNKTKEEKYNADLTLSLDQSPAINSYTYNADNKLVKETKLDRKGKTWKDPYKTVESSIKHTYEGEKLIRTDYLDFQDSLIDANFGASSTVYTYNELGQKITRTYLNKKGMLAPYWDLGPPILEYTYNKKGQIFQTFWKFNEGDTFEFKNFFYLNKKLLFTESFSPKDLKQVETREVYNYLDNELNMITTYKRDKETKKLKVVHKETNTQTIELSTPSWEISCNPPLPISQEITGTITFNVTVNKSGKIASYKPLYYAASTQMYTYCKDFLNRCFFIKIDEKEISSFDIEFTFKHL